MVPSSSPTDKIDCLHITGLHWYKATLLSVSYGVDGIIMGNDGQTHLTATYCSNEYEDMERNAQKGELLQVPLNYRAGLMKAFHQLIEIPWIGKKMCLRDFIFSENLPKLNGIHCQQQEASPHKPKQQILNHQPPHKRTKVGTPPTKSKTSVLSAPAGTTAFDWPDQMKCPPTKTAVSSRHVSFLWLASLILLVIHVHPAWGWLPPTSHSIIKRRHLTVSPHAMTPFDASLSSFWISGGEVAGADSTQSSYIDTGLLSNQAIVATFIVGLVPFAVATVEFWRRIAVGESFGTGKDSVVIIGEDNDPLSSRGRRVLGKGALITAYILFAIAAGVLGIVLYSVLTSGDPDSVTQTLPSSSSSSSS
jgi:hypothetical protein